MFYKLIIIYLVAIVGQVVFNIDIYFILFVSVAGLLIIISNSLRTYKGHSNFIKDIAISALFVLVFFLSTLYTKNKLDAVSYKIGDTGDTVISGQVVSLERGVNSNSITVETNESPKRLININVSGMNTVELFDQIEFEGEVKIKNWETYSEHRPLFFSYEFEHIFYNTPYTVSFPKKLQVIDSDISFTEKVLKQFKRTSETIFSTLSIYMPEPYAGIATAITYGTQNNLLKDIKDIFKKSGLIHIMVLSGANVSFIISIVWYFLRTTKSKFKVLTTVLFSWIFIFATGLQPPSVRAGVMTSSNILSEYFGKYVSPINSLLLSLFILTILNPLTLIYSASLHLSFLAVLGIFVLAPNLEKILKNKFQIFDKYKFLNFFISTTIAIFFATTPYILALSGSSSIFGTVLTIFLEPVIFASTILSFLTTIFGSLYGFIGNIFGTIFGSLNTVCIKIILSTAEFGAENLPQINFKISKLFLLIYYFIFIGLVLKMGNTENGIINKKEE